MGSCEEGVLMALWRYGVMTLKVPQTSKICFARHQSPFPHSVISWSKSQDSHLEPILGHLDLTITYSIFNLIQPQATRIRLPSLVCVLVRRL